MKSINQLLTRDEIRTLTKTSNALGWRSVGTTWGMIAGALTLAATFPNVLAISIAAVIIGGRQLALAILMHECAHRALFRSPSLNLHVGRWLCGAPIWSDVERYRTHHLSHHAHAGSDKDPDLSLAAGFPVSRVSMARKVLRDLTGITGVRRVVGLLLMDAGVFNYTASDAVTRATPTGRTPWEAVHQTAKNLAPTLLANTALFLGLYLTGHAWLYGIWVGAYLTVFSLVLRIRSIAEHACTDTDPDPLRHTRTTHAGWIARLMVAPHHVNYHTEHHLLPTVPHYRLAAMHHLLHQRGAFEDGHFAPNYRAVLASVTRP